MSEEVAVEEKPQEDEQEENLDETATERDGVKYVPLSEAQKARAKAREAKAEAERLKAEREKESQWVQFGQQAAPIVNALKDKPEIVKQLLDPNYKPEPGQSEEPVDEDLRALAESVDLYDASGKHDVKRAKTVQSVIDKRVQEAIREAIGPLKKQTATDKSASNYAWMLNQTDAQGNKVDKELVDRTFSNLAEEDRADPEKVSYAWLMAYGAQAMQQAQKKGKVPPPDSEPIMTESAGGRGQRVTLSEPLKKVAAELGMSEKDAREGLQKVWENDGVLE